MKSSEVIWGTDCDSNVQKRGQSWQIAKDATVLETARYVEAQVKTDLSFLLIVKDVMVKLSALFAAVPEGTEP